MARKVSEVFLNSAGVRGNKESLRSRSNALIGVGRGPSGPSIKGPFCHAERKIVKKRQKKKKKRKKKER